MMKFVVLVAFCATSAFAQLPCEGQCGSDAVCTMGPQCPETCGVDHSGSQKCMTRNWVPGCFCQNPNQVIASGFSNHCIDREQCTMPAMCRTAENRTFNSCGSSCGELKCNGETELNMCNMMCMPKCTCAPDYRLNDVGQCIHKNDC